MILAALSCSTVGSANFGAIALVYARSTCSVCRRSPGKVFVVLRSSNNHKRSRTSFRYTTTLVDSSAFRSSCNLSIDVDSHISLHPCTTCRKVICRFTTQWRDTLYAAWYWKLLAPLSTHDISSFVCYICTHKLCVVPTFWGFVLFPSHNTWMWGVLSTTHFLLDRHWFDTARM